MALRQTFLCLQASAATIRRLSYRSFATFSANPNVVDIDTFRTETTENDVRENMTPEELEIAKKKLIYRAKQRGWLEVDLLLGSFAENNVKNFNEDELRQFSRILAAQTVEIYNILLGTQETPKELDNDIMHKLRRFLKEVGPIDRSKPNFGYKGNQSVDYR